jgi:2-haloalkanoic acid dehalogenase type II
MPRPYELITFDCYGTLVDWETGIAAAFGSAPRAAVLDAYAAIEPEVEAGDYQPYREVLAETARRVAALIGSDLGPEGAELLARSLPRWPPFPDTVPALERLARAGYRLGILSNVDRDLLAATMRGLGVRFELVVTAEDVRSYKPAPAHFAEAERRLDMLGVPRASWLHAAQSLFHDVRPAVARGMRVAWVNRSAEPPPRDALPTHEFSTLAELAHELARAGV